MRPYYQDDACTIYHGDCREVFPSLAPLEFDHVITDPPYEIEAHTKGRRGNVGRDGAYGYSEARPIPFSPLTEELRAWLCALPCWWLLAFCQVEGVSKYINLLESKYRRTMVWIKPNAAPQFTGDRPGMGYESIVTAWCGQGRSEWNGGGKHGVYTYNTENGGGGKKARGFGHPTPKPLALMTALVSDFTNPEETIFDPFMGGGTTLRAAKDLGRKAIGIEIEEKYCEIAAKRMSQEVLPLTERVA